MAALKKAYAASCGVTEKTARAHARANHPDWLRFIGQSAIGALRAPSPATATALAMVSPMRPDPAEQPAAVDLDASLPEPVYMERAHWLVWSGTFRRWEKALAAGDEMLITLYAQQLPKQREAYFKARRDREAWDIANRNLIQAGEVMAAAQKFGTPLRVLIENIENELAAIANPEDPAFARRVIAEWKRERLIVPIEEFIDALDRVAPLAPAA